MTYKKECIASCVQNDEFTCRHNGVNLGTKYVHLTKDWQHQLNLCTNRKLAGGALDEGFAGVHSENSPPKSMSRMPRLMSS